jgi:hypothetical protein
MGKMKALLIDQEEEVEVEDQERLQEEAFYYHTINAFASLIIVYGYDNVIKDLKSKLRSMK